MFKDNFEERFNKRRKLIKRFIIGISIFVILGIFVQIGAVYYGYTKIEENGGFQKTATDILRVVKQIDKDSESK